MTVTDTLDLLHPPAGTVLGNHAVWLQSLGVKVPFQWGGLFTKRTRRERGYPRETLVDELAILRALAARGMAPPVGDLVYFRTVISDYPGAWHADPCGAYGYEMGDARALPPGRFDLEAMRGLPIDGSPGAWGDVAKPDNCVNGYLVDVRRSGQDLLRWTGERPGLPDPREPFEPLVAWVHRDGQFPAGEREKAYQDFWAWDELVAGQRRVVERAAALGFDPEPDETVVDVGCQTGGFLQLAAGRGARTLGVDCNGAYIDCARALAATCRQNVNLRAMDVVREFDAFVAWALSWCGGRPDHLLLLSMEKHLGEEALFRLLDALGARRTYLETNAVAKDDGTGPDPDPATVPHPERVAWPVTARGGRSVGVSRDRNLRILYRIDA